MTATNTTLNSPNSWLFDEYDLRYTPSRADGISYEREMYERALGVDLIVRVGAVRVDVPLLTIATASVFLHRFYMLESLKKYKARETAMACLFLAGKVEESLRKVETVVNYCLRLEDRRRGKEPDVHPSSDIFRRLVQQVLFVEEVILVALQFDLTLEHPHPLVTRAVKAQKGYLSQDQANSLGRAAWQILSDLYTTPACICYNTSTLAAASFLLAWSQLKDTLPEIPQDWTKSFEGIDWKDAEQVQEVNKVMQNALDLWKSAKSSKIKEAAAQLENNVTKAEFFKAEVSAVSSITVSQEELTPSQPAGATQDQPTDTTPAPAAAPASEQEQAQVSELASASTEEPKSLSARDDTKETPSMNENSTNEPSTEGISANADVEMEVESPVKEYEQPPTPG